MLVFDPSDPFPLLADGSYSHLDAVLHAEEADRWLGIETKKVEEEIGAREKPEFKQLWIGLGSRSLLTPYLEIRSMFSKLLIDDESRIVDLGAAYGRMAFVLGRHYSQCEFIGYEYVTRRVDEGVRALNRWNYPKVRLERADISDDQFRLPLADVYFIYDFGTRDEIERILERLRSVAKERSITVIGRGRATRDAVEQRHPWLSQMIQAEHCGNYSIYRS